MPLEKHVSNDLMDREWKAWQRVVAEFPDDINCVKFNRLTAAIQAWGEHLVALRSIQPANAIDKAMGMAERLYELRVESGIQPLNYQQFENNMRKIFGQAKPVKAVRL